MDKKWDDPVHDAMMELWALARPTLDPIIDEAIETEMLGRGYGIDDVVTDAVLQGVIEQARRQHPEMVSRLEELTAPNTSLFDVLRRLCFESYIRVGRDVIEDAVVEEGIVAELFGEPTLDGAIAKVLGIPLSDVGWDVADTHEQEVSEVLRILNHEQLRQAAYIGLHAAIEFSSRLHAGLITGTWQLNKRTGGIVMARDAVRTWRSRAEIS